MEYHIIVNQQMCVKYKLTYLQGALMEFFGKLSTWADAYTFEDGVYYNISYGKIVRELPVIFTSEDKVYRLTKTLVKLELIEQRKKGKDLKNFIRLSVKGKRILRFGKNPEACQGSGKIPTRFVKNPEPQKNAVSPENKEILNQGSGKIPTNHNQYTNNHIYIDFSAYEFLQKNAQSELEVWEMQNKKSIQDFDRFLEFFQIKVEEEEIEYTVPKLFGRLRRLKFNWSGDLKIVKTINEQPTIKRKRLG
jgi:hypothetical protein